MRASAIAALILLTLATSCTEGPTTASPPSPSTSTVSPSPAAAPSSQPVIDYSSFTHALDAAEFTVRRGGRAGENQLFSVPGRTLFIDDAQISTFEYPSQEALDEERSLISPDGYSIPTRDGGLAMVEWVGTPHFYSAGKLLIVYVGDERSTLEALNLVLGPQFAGG